MTVRDCYEQALAFVPEIPEENPDMQKYMVRWCNMLLAETLPYENVYRRGKGISEQETAAKLEDENEEIPYNETMVRAAFPYGMARFIFRESEDISASREFYQLYVMALGESVPVIMGETEDFYA